MNAAINRVLVVDDDPNIRELVSKILSHEGFEIIEAHDGREALGQLGDKRVDAVVLDVMMPNMDGFTFTEMVRRYYADLPILMLTALGETAQKVKGFSLGADDYLIKPFEPAELVARLRALLKRYQKNSSAKIAFGTVQMDALAHTCQVDGAFEELPLKEFELLFALAGAKGRTLSRRQLIDDIWGYDFCGNERTLDVHINRLRERFEVKGCGFKIVTIRGLGYRLMEST
ncbi:MAG: response regulator transcription factor [Coriobacteriales bacterium]|jgi:DNA-binding response OmpR family regulator|nr:response regulator transcription factor [Coriobacteriales bacterium]